jgi:hypothetical protein
MGETDREVTAAEHRPVQAFDGILGGMLWHVDESEAF